MKTNQSLVRVILLSSISLLVGSSITFSATKITAKKQNSTTSISTNFSSESQFSNGTQMQINRQNMRSAGSIEDVVEAIDPITDYPSCEDSSDDGADAACCSAKSSQDLASCDKYTGIIKNMCINNADERKKNCVCRVAPSSTECARL